MEINYTTIESKPLSSSKSFIANVFAWMSLALIISAVISYAFGNNMELMQYLRNTETFKPTMLGYIVMFAPLILVMTMSFAFNRLSFILLAALFVFYSICTGLSLSFIFIVYTAGSIATTFIGAAAMFGLMAVVGYTTKTDLTSFGKLMMMGLVGIIIASLINMFVGSSSFDYIISTIGVLVFTGLTAYDVQKIKQIGQEAEYKNMPASKLSIIGALNLYLDFINLFLMLLRLFGGRKD